MAAGPAGPVYLRDTDEARAFERAPWLREARLLLDHDPRELEGGGRRFLGWISRLDRKMPISIAWCGLFVAHCLRTARPDLEPPLDRPRARPWRKIGVGCEPQLGAIMVFWRISPYLPFGHAGFYWAEDDECFHILGGNQHDRVTIGRADKRRFIDARWPDDGPQTGLRRRAAPEDAEPQRRARA